MFYLFVMVGFGLMFAPVLLGYLVGLGVALAVEAESGDRSLGMVSGWTVGVIVAAVLTPVWWSMLSG